jgi:release factor glutamine methyltransferase
MTEAVPVIPEASFDSTYERCLAQLTAAWVGLPDKPEESPEATLRALWLAAGGDPCSAELAVRRGLPLLDAAGTETLEALVRRRLSGVPLAHLTGRQSFMGLELLAGPEALIPRRETELLATAALERLEGTVAERGGALVLDVCCGSGNLALALAHHVPQCTVIGGDLSPDAVRLAEGNAELTGLGRRVRFVQGDLFAPFEAAGLGGAADMIVCNPPYISTAKAAAMPAEIAAYEPRLAFDGGPFGIAILFRVVTGAPQLLKPRSWLGLEVGAGQGEPMATRLERSGSYDIVERVHDARGEVRALLARTGPREGAAGFVAPSVR